jgi:hypothetical protein
VSKNAKFEKNAKIVKNCKNRQKIAKIVKKSQKPSKNRQKIEKIPKISSRNHRQVLQWYCWKKPPVTGNPYRPRSNDSPRKQKKCIEFHIKSATRVGKSGIITPLRSVGVKKGAKKLES